MGDNLEDLPIDIFQKPLDERLQIAEQPKKNWGKKFIVLPNPMYGAWERPIMTFEMGLSTQQRDERRKAHVRPWQPKP